MRAVPPSSPRTRAPALLHTRSVTHGPTPLVHARTTHDSGRPEPATRAPARPRARNHQCAPARPSACAPGIEWMDLRSLLQRSQQRSLKQAPRARNQQRAPAHTAGSARCYSRARNWEARPRVTDLRSRCTQAALPLQLRHLLLKSELLDHPPCRSALALCSQTSFISNRQWRKDGTFCASELAGIEPTPARS